jgi:hypothetical protein
MPVDIEALKRNPQSLRLYSSRLSLKKDGREYLGSCPFHSEKTPSFKVYQHDGIFLFKCFGCNASGNAIQFIEKKDGITFKEAVKIAGEEIGDTSSWEAAKDHVDRVFQPPVAEEKVHRTLTLAQIAPLERNLTGNPAAQKWLAGRGITMETAQRLHIGFKQDLGSLAHGLAPEVIAGGWLAFPCVEGDVVKGIKYRSLAIKTFRKQPNMATTLYNLDDIDPLEPVYLVEGEPDAAVLVQAGFRAVSLPSASTTVTPEMRDQLMAADSVILAGDCDGGVGSQIMERLWRDLGDRSCLLKWPDGKKDANQTFLETCGGDVAKFRESVERLTVEAKGNPMPEFTSIQKALLSGKSSQMADHPHRLRLPWAGVDGMAVLLPGSVLMVSATNTSMGKSQFVNQICIHAARQGEVVVNYQVEMTAEEIATITAAHITKSDRNELTPDKSVLAARILKDAQYYVGNDPTLTSPGPVFDLLEKAVRRLGATVVVLDHIHFLCRGDNEIRDQAEASRRMKLLAQNYKVKFIVVGQPRKADSKGKGKVLHITDIKGSASIGDDIDAFFALHRNVVQNPDPNNPPMDLYEPETEIHCLKARSRGRGAAFTKLYFMGALATFTDITHAEPPPA